MKDIYCQACRNVTGKIITKRGFVCWDCYNVEQKIHKAEDWRDTVLREYTKTHDMVQREGENKKNLANRCKKFLNNNGFIFK